MSAPLPSTERRSAREKLLAAADELFYEGGIHSVGIDRVIARAGVAKASLYDTFGSKDALISAYLAARQDGRKGRVEARLATVDTPREKLLAVFDALGETMADPSYRGCAFSRAGADAPPTDAVKGACDDARTWLRGLFASLLVEAGATTPEVTARQLVLLYDGAAVAALMDGAADAAAMAKVAAAAMIDAACPSTPRPARSRKTPSR